MDKMLMLHQIGWDSMYMVWHAAKTNQIIYTHSTGGSIVFGDRIYPIQKGALCFISSQCYHYTMPDNPDTYDRSKIIFSDEFLSLAGESAMKCGAEPSFTANSAVYALIPEELQPEVEAIYREANECGNFGKHGDLYFLSCLLRLFGYLDLYQLETIPAPTDFIAKTLDYINNHVSENITVDDICTAIPMSKYYFCRRFKAALNMTVMDYILKTRLTLAKNMLVKEETSVTGISEACGFSSISYFCRVFKNDTGMTPQEYRRNGFRPDP